jgi:hypothetical protein
MTPSMSQPSLPTPIRVSDTRARTAKASIRKADTKALYKALGGCIADVIRAHGLSLKEFSAEIGKDERQMARQIDGTDRPQLEAVFAIQRFQAPLVIALAKLATGVEIDTVLTFRRSA